MVQVDVFWSYGLGAGFAMTAARQLRARQEVRRAGGAYTKLASEAGEPRPGDGGVRELSTALAGEPAPPAGTSWWADFKDLLQNRYMMFNILFAALLFAPSGIYLVWGTPNWETMQVGGRGMPSWLIVTFAITNITQAILGFWVTERLIVNGRQYLGALQAWFGYFGMFFILVHGWDSFGWHRFFSEDKADFLAWNSQPALDQVNAWLTSDVALTLYGMGLILIPVMAVAMMRNFRTGYRLGGAFKPNAKPASASVLFVAYTAFLLSGVPVAVASHAILDQLGWILGGVVSAALIYGLLMRPGTGLFYFGYKKLGTEDAAYEQLLAKRNGGSRQPTATPAPGRGGLGPFTPGGVQAPPGPAPSTPARSRASGSLQPLGSAASTASRMSWSLKPMRSMTGRMIPGKSATVFSRRGTTVVLARRSMPATAAATTASTVVCFQIPPVLPFHTSAPAGSARLSSSIGVAKKVGCRVPHVTPVPRSSWRSELTSA